MIITVVTPTLNGIAFLRECIESVRANEENGLQIEHVIVDGGSTDSTVEMARSYGLRVLTGKDRGIFDAINKGSFNSSGELLGFLGADDVMLPGAMRAVAEAYRRSGRRWVVGAIRWLDDRGRDLGQLKAPPEWMTPRMHVCLGWNPIMHMSTYIAREFFTELGGFNIEYKVSGDYEMFARALSAAPHTRLERPISFFRRTGCNNSAVDLDRADRECRAICDRFGPATTLERLVWKMTLKAWFNLTSPEWVMHKMLDSARLRLRLQEHAYF